MVGGTCSPHRRRQPPRAPAGCLSASCTGAATQMTADWAAERQGCLLSQSGDRKSRTSFPGLSPRWQLQGCAPSQGSEGGSPAPVRKASSLEVPGNSRPVSLLELCHCLPTFQGGQERIRFRVWERQEGGRLEHRRAVGSRLAAPAPQAPGETLPHCVPHSPSAWELLREGEESKAPLQHPPRLLAGGPLS